MSNINLDIATAFAEGKARKIKNTRTDGKIVELFGNMIATRPHPSLLRISLGGQRCTKTTQARLNAILDKFNTGYTVKGYHRFPVLAKKESERGVSMENDKWYVVTIPETMPTPDDSF